MSLNQTVRGLIDRLPTLTSEFTVHEIGYDARGVLNRFRATFEQHCEGGDAAARGTIAFSS